ncbi:unnamed protein product [Brassicogethes aeneus]|uniref:Potassium channel domain-containing protein n=1 Tax=Brassicogethes aeneus TaxID=1431903 RepID=A0A9P0AW01_BRAAE|nr:unnamed protein product [Brassicogethes aeneus]
MERKRSVRRPRRRQTFAKKCKEYARQFIAFLFSNVGIILLVVGYTIAGSFIFMSLEKKYHMKLKQDVYSTRKMYAEKFWNITMDMNPFDEKVYKAIMMDELYTYQKLFVNFTRKGYDGFTDEETSSQWSFAGAFLYSLTVITTIGYGNIFPHTPEGKITTIVYAIIGMPLFLLYLSNIGDIMARSFKWVYANCCLCRWCPGVSRRRAERRMRKNREQYVDYSSGESSKSSSNYRINIERPSSSSQTQESKESSVSDEITEIDGDDESYDVQTVTVPITICLLIMVGYICGGALLFCRWEDWKMMDASYFCFISLSTIGFGDLVPGDKIFSRGNDFYSEVLELSFVFCSMYLMLGMALIAMCFNLMQEEVIHKIRTTVKTVNNIFQCKKRNAN